MVNQDQMTLDINKLKEAAKKSTESGKKARHKLAVLEKFNFRCALCGSRDRDDLSIHHVKKNKYFKYKNSKSYDPKICISLCTRCHQYIHGRII